MPSFARLIVSVSGVFLAIATVASITALRCESRNSSPPVVQREVDEAQYPVANFDSEEPADQSKASLRRARNRRHDIDDKNINAQELKAFGLKETDPPILFQLVPSHAHEQAPLPVVESDSIVIGQVTSAQAHLSNDRSNVYSEFQVRVVQVLKTDNVGFLVSGDLITTERPGGRVRFSSGKTLLRGSVGRSMPLMAQRYLFFLKYHDEGQDYSIITAYELRDRRVFPLDDYRKVNEDLPTFASNKGYENADETNFIRGVKAAIARRRIQ